MLVPIPCFVRTVKIRGRCGILNPPMKPGTSSTRAFSPWYLLLLLPFIGLCFPGFYARATPMLFGFPFFYWYQFAWVALASFLIGIVYKKTKP